MIMTNVCCVQPSAQGSPLRDALPAQHQQGDAREPRLFGRRGQLNVIRDETEREIHWGKES